MWLVCRVRIIVCFRRVVLLLLAGLHGRRERPREWRGVFEMHWQRREWAS